MSLQEYPLSQLLQNRTIFAIFDEEFAKDTWLDVTALLRSDSTIKALYSDGTVPHATLDRVVARLAALDYSE
ncbi:MAG: hypothetical protein HUJ71_02515 [Pseudobutyrivibrio sp.]|nr:hypothetical protein [Pseudobutyrivibrio sp.]